MSMQNKVNEDDGRLFTRRSLIFLGAQAGFVGLLGARMRFLQVDQSEQFRSLAEENRINIRLLPPARGQIFDRNGYEVAINQQNYRVVIVREQAGDVAEVLDRLAQIIPLTEEERERALKEILRRPAFVPVAVKENLSWEDIAAVSANSPALPGITPEVGLSRYYPMAGDFAHIAGYVGPVSDYDLSKIDDQDPLLQIPRFQIGKSGIETKIERKLRGQAGIKRIEVNAVGRVMRELDRKEGDSGVDLQLTVDAKLQNYVQARLAGESAAAVVMDVRNGDLLALGSAPTFDPNKFVTGISVADYQALLENPYRPLANKTVQGTYPPGSTFKMMVALAAVEDGLITEDETIRCNGYYQLGNQRFHCWKRGGHGRMNLHNGLKNSCDVYYYEVSQRVGIEKIAAMARRFGLGVQHELPVSAVAEGLIPTKAWKAAHRENNWVVGDTLNAAIGQGFVLASPLQLATMAARIASGNAVEPRLLKSVANAETTLAPPAPLGVSKKALDAVRAGMFAVSNERGGTAYSTRIDEKSMAMAGKTGTSQVRRITEKERREGVTRNADLPWKRRDHALFVGFAPYDDPKFAISVIVEHGGGGSAVAAPIARDIMLHALYNGFPPLSAYPSHQRNMINRDRKDLKLRDFPPASAVRDRA